MIVFVQSDKNMPSFTDAGMVLCFLGQEVTRQISVLSLATWWERERLSPQNTRKGSYNIAFVIIAINCSENMVKNKWMRDIIFEHVTELL